MQYNLYHKLKKGMMKKSKWRIKNVLNQIIFTSLKQKREKCISFLKEPIIYLELNINKIVFIAFNSAFIKL